MDRTILIFSTKDVEGAAEPALSRVTITAGGRSSATPRQTPYVRRLGGRSRGARPSTSVGSWTQSAGIALAALLVASSLHAQAFDSGSDGRDGDLVVSASVTLDVPPDGIFRFGTVTINSGPLVKFRRNALNTPVFILATGDIILNAAVISVSGTIGSSSPPAGGSGGPGGFDGGQPGLQGIPPGDGNGPGAGAGGDSAGGGSYRGTPSAPQATDGTPYGSPLLLPLVGGSGGGGTSALPNSTDAGLAGGGGGGAILLASNTRIQLNSTQLTVSGGPGSFGGGAGSGGAVRLVAPVVSGNGSIDVQGGDSFFGAKAGPGRVRIDTLDRRELLINVTPVESRSVGRFMAVFPPLVPKLDVIEVAGQAIAPGTPAEIILPFGSNPNQTVKVRVSDFNGTVPFDVVLVPDSGPRSVVSTQTNTSGNPVDVTVNVTVPLNNRTRVEAWTR